MRCSTALIGAIALVVTLSGCARSGEPYLVGSADAGSSRSTEPTIQAIEDYSATNFPENFTGVATDIDQRTIVVYRVPGSDLDSAISTRFPGAPVRFVGARFTRQQLRALTEEITADASYWASRGVQITLVGPASDGNSVEVGVGNLAAAQDALYTKYGRANIRVIAQAPMSMGPYNGPLTAPEQPKASN